MQLVVNEKIFNPLKKATLVVAFFMKIVVGCRQYARRSCIEGAHLDEIKDLATAIGAVIAAVASCWNLVLNIRGSGDRIRVTYGPLLPGISPGESLYVASESAHRVTLKDYGFIDKDGRLHSLPYLYDELEPSDADDLPVFNGERSFEKRGEIFEVRWPYWRRQNVAAYAISVGQRCHRIGFKYDTPFLLRCRIAVRVWLRPTYH